jgi:uncharacterized membrane protein
MHPLFTVLLFTLIPALELRASIPYALLATDLPLLLTLLPIIVVNILLGIAVYELLDLCIRALRRLAWFERVFTRIIERPRRRIKRAIERWGELGVAVFIGIPLPGSGVYTAALGAYLLGVRRKHFYLATVIGVLIAAVLVTAITLSGSALFAWAVRT